MPIFAYSFAGAMSDLNAQGDALHAEGATIDGGDIGEDSDTERPVLVNILAKLAPGDTLMVTNLHRLGPTADAVMDVMKAVGERGATLRAIFDHIEISPDTYRLGLRCHNALVAIETGHLRHQAALEMLRAKRRRSNAGRPRSLTPEQVAHARDSIDSGQQSVSSMAKLMKVNKTTLWRAIKAGA